MVVLEDSSGRVAVAVAVRRVVWLVGGIAKGRAACLVCVCGVAEPLHRALFLFTAYHRRLCQLRS